MSDQTTAIQTFDAAPLLMNDQIPMGRFSLAERIAEHVHRNKKAERFVPIVYVMDAISEFEREGFEIVIRKTKGGAK